MRHAWCAMLTAALTACATDPDAERAPARERVNAAQLSASPRYDIVRITDSLGGTSSLPTSISNNGLIAGFSNLPGNGTRHAALWIGGAITDLGTLGGPNSNVQWPGLNNDTVVVGIAETAEPDSLNEDWSCSAFYPTVTHKVCRGFIWRSGVMTALPTFGGTHGFATGVNAQRQVVGWAETTVFDPTCNASSPQRLQFRAALWEPDQGTMRELRPYAGDSTSAATAINDRGQAVGISGDCDVAVGRHSARHALLWEGDAVIPIGDLGGIGWHTPMALNERGDVVGFSNPASHPDDTFLPHAFLWTRQDGIQDLGLLPGHTFSQAFAINTRGEIVGRSCGAAGCLAVIWVNGEPVDMHALVGPGFPDLLLSARAINDAGVITGNVRVAATGRTVVFVATPRP